MRCTDTIGLSMNNWHGMRAYGVAEAARLNSDSFSRPLSVSSFLTHSLRGENGGTSQRALFSFLLMTCLELCTSGQRIELAQKQKLVERLLNRQNGCLFPTFFSLLVSLCALRSGIIPISVPQNICTVRIRGHTHSVTISPLTGDW